ncbi:universal stress protein [Variovorax dokdonensis]|uniref:Universal stress protein n=1 Tax=Variovorax dokdonensis TaxID=344883 RepID=A0ABT7NAV1_9BURK|nr:universal stress protein [Variovorax dokdonensis]MDM0045059.1 universal stress protein [Variovorax dokdonensis]
MKILLAVDGSEYTQRMLDYLGTHKESLGANSSYVVLTAVFPVPPHPASFLSGPVLRGYYDDEARKVLDPIRAYLGQHGFAAEYAHRVGRPADEICAFAEQGGFDLIVMGSHGHGALGNLVLGSVATQVLARCSTPVMLVR